MASAVGICNAALRKVGEAEITSLTQGTDEANFCNTRYAEIRDWLLEGHQWNFAIKSAKLAQTTTTPAVDFDYQYALPADYIRVVSVHDSNEGRGVADHKIRGQYIEANASELWLVYVSQITDPNDMTPMFRNCLADAIAVEAASALVESNVMREQMREQFERSFRRARSADAQADLPDRMPIGSWVTTRTGRIGDRRWNW